MSRMKSEENYDDGEDPYELTYNEDKSIRNTATEQQVSNLQLRVGQNFQILHSSSNYNIISIQLILIAEESALPKTWLDQST